MRDDFTLDVPAVLEAVTERTKLLFLCSPNNPTGKRIEEGAPWRLLRLGIPTVVDEAHVEFGDDDTSVADLIATTPNLVVVRTSSKAFGLAGVRVGYALACEPVIRLLTRVKLPWNVSTLALAATCGAATCACRWSLQTKTDAASTCCAARSRATARGPRTTPRGSAQSLRSYAEGGRVARVLPLDVATLVRGYRWRNPTHVRHQRPRGPRRS